MEQFLSPEGGFAASFDQQLLKVICNLFPESSAARNADTFFAGRRTYHSCPFPLPSGDEKQKGQQGQEGQQKAISLARAELFPETRAIKQRVGTQRQFPAIEELSRRSPILALAFDLLACGKYPKVIRPPLQARNLFRSCSSEEEREAARGDGSAVARPAETLLEAIARDLRNATRSWCFRDSVFLRADRRDMADRVILVGPYARARLIASLMDVDESSNAVRVVVGCRLTGVMCGTFKGVPVTVIAFGSGAPACDITMREWGALAKRPCVAIRLGTCTALREEVQAGDVFVATKGAVNIRTNFQYFHRLSPELERHLPLAKVAAQSAAGVGTATAPFHSTKKICGCPRLTSNLHAELMKVGKSRQVGEKSLRVYEGLNGSAEGFYTCQGRPDTCFADGQYDLLSHLKQRQDDDTGRFEPIDYLDMETYQVFHAAKIHDPPIAAAACHVAMAHPDLGTAAGLSAVDLAQVEEKVALAVLNALVDYTPD